MTSPRHVVLRQIVEVTVPAKRQVQRVHDSLSRACRAGVAKILEQQCDRLSDPSAVHRIDRLEVNLGRLRLEDFEESFDAALKVELANAVRRSERESGGARESRVASQFELIDCFFRTGALPWWAENSSPRPWADGLRFLARAAAPELRQWLRELTADVRSLRRLIICSTDMELGEWVDVMAPSPNSMVSAAAQELTSIIQLLGVPHSAGATRVSVWRGILVASARGSTWPSEPNRWLREVLVWVSAAMGQSLASLISQLRAQLETSENSAGAEWHRALRSLEQESDSTDAAEGAVGPWSSFISAVKPFLAHAPEPTRTHWIEWVQLVAPPKLDGMKNPAGPGGLRNLDRWLRPALASGVVPPDVLAEWLAGAREAKSWAPPELAAAVEAVLREMGRPEIAASPARILRPAWRSGFSESDGVFVNNAGLVLLWPFLTPLFQRLGLLEEKHFKNDIAQQRAVGLLQFIADGNPEPPSEHLLPLNKLLCGLATDEVFEFGDGVNETEVEESAAVLRAVIEQAPRLGKISSDGFRGSFLLRRGQLRVHAESALLRVERETYDIVLERLPWPVNWVRLPWMSVSLQVEWL